MKGRRRQGVSESARVCIALVLYAGREPVQVPECALVLSPSFIHSLVLLSQRSCTMDQHIRNLHSNWSKIKSFHILFNDASDEENIQ